MQQDRYEIYDLWGEETVSTHPTYDEVVEQINKMRNMVDHDGLERYAVMERDRRSFVSHVRGQDE